MTIDQDGSIVGVPEEWKELLKDIYTSNDLKPTEENLIQATKIVQTSLKRNKTINEGKVMKIIDEDSFGLIDEVGGSSKDEFEPAPLRKKISGPGPRVDKKMKPKEIMLELQNLCLLKNPWTLYNKV